MAGQEVIPSVCGPLAHSVEDLKIFVQSVLAQRPWKKDPKVIVLPWNEPQLPKKLCFGVFRWDRRLYPHPPVVRALNEAVDALQKAGHEVIEWDPPMHHDGNQYMNKIFGADGGKDILDACAMSGEPPVTQLSVFLSKVQEISVSEYWQATNDRRDYQMRYMEYWNSTKDKTTTGRPVDAWISPVAVLCGIKPGEWLKLGFQVSYTQLLNMLDYPVCVVPVTNVDAKVDVPNTSYKPVNETDEQVWKAYEPKTFDGMPISVQVIAPRLEEENVLAYADVLDRALRSVISL